MYHFVERKKKASSFTLKGTNENGTEQIRFL
jgi:hypothetical protein